MDTTLLHEQIAAVCPIDGVSVGDVADKTTWRIDYADTATDAQKQAAQSVVSAFNPTAPTKADLEAERDRRLSLGFSYTFADTRGTHRIGTTEKDLKGWDEVSKIANAAINTGSPGSTINIVTNTGPCTVTATEWQQIVLAAGQFRQPIWQASFSLLYANPIPPDYAADYHWPPVA